MGSKRLATIWKLPKDYWLRAFGDFFTGFGRSSYDYGGSKGFVLVLWVLSFLTFMSLQVLKRRDLDSIVLS